MNKRNILFVCNTVFQCITAITLKYNEFANDNVDIIISDHMNDSYTLYKRIKSINLFNKIYYVRSAGYSYYKENIPKNKVEKLIAEAFPKLVGFEIEKAYDILMIYNHDRFAQTLFSELIKKNKHIEVKLFDEGLSTYTDIYQKIISNISKKRRYLSVLTRRKFIHERVNGIYLFEPDLLCWNSPYPVHKIKKADKDDTEYKKLLNKAFGYEEIQDKYDKKFIFFEESFYHENIEIGDVELVEKIGQMVGKENIFIKIHPRNPNNRFEKLGYATNKDTGIPWEIIAFNKDFSDSIFVSISSSSVLTPRILFGQKTQTYLLHKCLKVESPFATTSAQEYFDKFLEKFGENLYILDDIEQIKLNM